MRHALLAIAVVAMASRGVAPQGSGEAAATPPPAREAGRPPGPRAALAGWAGFQAVSEVRMAVAPDDPHLLEVATAFPDRARWTLRRRESADRRLEYRFGEHGSVIDVGERASAEVALEELDGFHLRHALRQAAFFWPEGAHWRPVDSCEEAWVGRLFEDPEGQAIGRLRAELDGAGLPRRIEAIDARGRVQEALEIRSWQEVAERRWPLELGLWVDGELVWQERVVEVAPQRTVERFFVPHDRRALLRPFAEVERRREAPCAGRRFALMADCDWPAALARAEAERAALLARPEQAPELQAGAWIHLDPATLLPLAVELRLASVTEPLPEGFELRAGRDILRLALGGDAPPSAADQARLREVEPRDRPTEAWTAAIQGSGEVLFDRVLAP